MADDSWLGEGWQARRERGGVPPDFFGGLSQLVRMLGNYQTSSDPSMDPEAAQAPYSSIPAPKDQTRAPSGPEPQPEEQYFPQPAPSPLTQIATQPQAPQQAPGPDPSQLWKRVATGPQAMPSQPIPGSDPTRQAALERPEPIPPSALDKTPARLPGPSQQFVPNRETGWRLWGEANAAMRAYPNNTWIGDTSHMPSFEEGLGVVRGASGQMAQWGAPEAQPFARVAHGIANAIGPIMDFYSKGVFGRTWDQATAKRVALRREEMEIERDRMIDNGNKAIMASRAHLNKYRDKVFGPYDSKVFSEDPVKNDELAKQLAYFMAGQDNDTQLQHAIANGGLRDAEKLLESRNRNMLDTWSGVLALENAPGRSGTGKTAKEESALDKSIVEGAPSAGGRSDLPGAGGPAEQKAEQEKRRHPASPEEYDASLQRDFKMGPRGAQLARDKFETDKPGGETPTSFGKAAPKHSPQVTAAADQMRDDIESIANGPGTPEEKLDAIGKISPKAASAGASLLNYSANPKDKENERWNQLAHLLSPGPKGYDEKRYAAASEFYKQNGPPQRILSRADLMPTLAAVALEKINALPEDGSVTAAQVQQIIDGNFTGDPRWSEAYNALRAFGFEAAALVMQGVPRVTATHDFLQHAQPWRSPATLRNLIKTDIGVADSAIDHVIKSWRDVTNLTTNPPSYNPDNHKLMKYEAMINSRTGQVSKNAPDELRAVNKKPDPGHRPKWRKEADELPPPASIEDAQMLTRALAHPEDPMSAAIIEDIRKRAQW
jgi:hypothetical protein